MASFTQLATELLWIIVDSFSQRDLHSSTLVNKQLYIATNHLLWRFRQLPDGDTTDIILSKATTEYHPVGQWLQKLELYFDYWTDVRLFDLIDNSNLDHLEELHLGNTMNLTDQSVIHLARRSPTLKQVHLFKLPNITQQFMNALGYYCLQLNKLVLRDCTGLGSDSYSALQHCPIQVMHISKPPDILQTEMAMWDLIVHYPLLTELELSTGGIDGLRFMKQLLTAAAGAWPYLTTLALGYYGPPLSTSYIERYEEDPPLVVFLKYHQVIKRLHLHQCDIPGYIWNCITDLGLPFLEELNIDSMHSLTPYVIGQLVNACPRLSFFSLPDYYKWPRELQLNEGYQGMDDLPSSIRHILGRLQIVHYLDQEHIDKIRNSGILPITTMDTLRNKPRRRRGALRNDLNATIPQLDNLYNALTTNSSHTTADARRRLTSTSTSLSRATMALTPRTPWRTTPSALATLSRARTTTSSDTIADTIDQMISAFTSRSCAEMAITSRTITAAPSPTIRSTPLLLTTAITPSRARETTSTRTPRTTPPRSPSTSPRSMPATLSHTIATTSASSRIVAAATPSRTSMSMSPTVTATIPLSRASIRRTMTTSSDTAASTSSCTTTTSPWRTISMAPRTQPRHPSPRSTITTCATTNSSRTTTSDSPRAQQQQTPLRRRWRDRKSATSYFPQ